MFHGKKKMENRKMKTNSIERLTAVLSNKNNKMEKIIRLEKNKNGDYEWRIKKESAGDERFLIKINDQCEIEKIMFVAVENNTKHSKDIELGSQIGLFIDSALINTYKYNQREAAITEFNAMGRNTYAINTL
jgi:hypothetical protein